MAHTERSNLPRTLGGAAIVGVLATLFFSWVLPTVLIHYQLIRHHVTVSDQAYVSAQGREHDVWHSRILLGDWYQIYPRSGGGPTDRQASLPSWVAIPPELDDAIRVDSASTGIPLRAFASEAWIYPGPRQPEFRHNLVLYSGPNGRTILPLRPLWAGIIGNSIFFALLWLGLRAAARWAVRRRRRSRGLCEGCGYDTRTAAVGDRCPECGSPSFQGAFDPRAPSSPIG